VLDWAEVPKKLGLVFNSEINRTQRRGEVNKKRIFIVFALLSKSAKLMKLVKAVKFLKFGKIAITFATMALSAFVYSFTMGIWFSVGFVLMLFIHEMGHVIALKLKRLPASAPVFIPMLGAVVFAPDFGDKEKEAFVGFGGPLLGGLAAFLVFLMWKTVSDSSMILLMLSYTATFVNLFNLIPIRPLDGGRITQAIGSWFKYVGVAGLLMFSLLVRQPVMLFIWILVLEDIRMNKWLKFGIGALCQVSMIILMILGFSDQPFWVDILDSVLVTVLNIGYYFRAKTKETEEVKQKTEGVLPSSARIKWFAFYFLLLATLSLLMFYQIPYLPKK